MTIFLVWDTKCQQEDNLKDGDEFRDEIRSVTPRNTLPEAMATARSRYGNTQVSQLVIEIRSDGSHHAAGFVGEMEGFMLDDYGAAWSWATKEKERGISSAVAALFKSAVFDRR